MRGKRKATGERRNATQKSWSWRGVTVAWMGGGAIRVLWGPDNGLTVPVPAVNLLLSGGETEQGNHKNVMMESVCLTACLSVRTNVLPITLNNRQKCYQWRLHPECDIM